MNFNSTRALLDRWLGHCIDLGVLSSSSTDITIVGATQSYSNGGKFHDSRSVLCRSFVSCTEQTLFSRRYRRVESRGAAVAVVFLGRPPAILVQSFRTSINYISTFLYPSSLRHFSLFLFFSFLLLLFSLPSRWVSRATFTAWCCNLHRNVCINI